MKVVKRYNQNRRDLTIDIECEFCGNGVTGKSAYDDRNFWANVVPVWECKKCGKSTKSEGGTVGDVSTMYPDGLQL